MLLDGGPRIAGGEGAAHGQGGRRHLDVAGRVRHRPRARTWRTAWAAAARRLHTWALEPDAIDGDVLDGDGRRDRRGRSWAGGCSTSSTGRTAGTTRWATAPRRAAQPPVLVVTRIPPDEVRLADRITFVVDGIGSAVAKGVAMADDRDVVIMGGAETVRRALEAGVVDELRLHLSPVLLGAGTPLFTGGHPASTGRSAGAAARPLSDLRSTDEPDRADLPAGRRGCPPREGRRPGTAPRRRWPPPWRR